MPTTRDVMKSLPLIASVLGRQYGVTITQGGDTASTNGKTVNIPALPLASDAETLALVRGYIDHEAGGHVRFTDFEKLREAKLDPIESAIMNSIEDWRVESKLSEFYPGCRANLAWLVKRFFVEKWEPNDRPETSIFDYILLTCRSWTVDEVETNRRVAGDIVEKNYRQLLPDMQRILSDVRMRCDSTASAISYAKKLAALTKKFLPSPIGSLNPQQGDILQTGGGSGDGEPAGGCEGAPRQGGGNDKGKNGKNTRQSGTNGKRADGKGEQGEKDPYDFLPKDLGTLIAKVLDDIAEKSSWASKAGTAIPMRKTVRELTGDEHYRAMHVSAGLRNRLAGTLQAETLRKVAPSRRGRLNSHSLYKVFVNDQKVFSKDASAIALDTAVHILVDASGSMCGESIRVARQAAYAISVALAGVKGVSVGVTVFPASSYGEHACVLPVLKHGSRVHRNFAFDAIGGTPLAESLLWTMQTLIARKEPRKIVFVITDGCPDNSKTARDAFEEMKKYGIEPYGIGILDGTIKQLLPGKSTVVNNVEELTGNLFSLMQNALVSRWRR